jgi:hypothetical protein
MSRARDVLAADGREREQLTRIARSLLAHLDDPG